MVSACDNLSPACRPPCALGLPNAAGFVGVVGGYRMIRQALVSIGVAAVCFSRPLLAADEQVILPALEVVGEPLGHSAVDPQRKPFATSDTADLLRRVPGAHVNVNGPITGMAQYRGMFGQRLNVRLNGTPVEPGGPNWMDPPLQYMPRSLLKSIKVIRGVAPVSTGSGMGALLRRRRSQANSQTRTPSSSTAMWKRPAIPSIAGTTWAVSSPWPTSSIECISSAVGTMAIIPALVVAP